MMEERVGNNISSVRPHERNSDESPYGSNEDEKLQEQYQVNDFVENESWLGQYSTPGYEGINVTREFKQRVYEIALRFDMNPDDLMALMASESKIATCMSPYTGGKSVGLLQFTNAYAQHFGYDLNQIAAMDGLQQLDLVE